MDKCLSMSYSAVIIQILSLRSKDPFQRLTVDYKKDNI